MTSSPPRLPIVLIHGFIGHLQFAELIDGGTILAPDLLGYGQYRACDAQTITVRGQVDHLLHTINAWVGSRQPVLVVAHSAGATVAVRLAQRYPARVGGLLIAEGNLAASDAFLAARLGPMSLAQVEHWLGRMRADPERLLAADGVPVNPDTLARMQGWLQHQDAEALHRMARSVLLESVTPNYALTVATVTRDVPTGLVFGERSPNKRMIAEPVKSSIVATMVMADVGHLLPLEAPGGFRLQIAAFAAMVEELAGERFRATL